MRTTRATSLCLSDRGTHGLLQLHRGLLQSNPAALRPGVSLAHLLRTGDANRPTVRHPLNRPPKRGNFMMEADVAIRRSGQVDLHQPGWWLKTLSASAGLLLLLAACAAPVQVDRVDLRSAYDELNRTALSSDQLSEVTRTVVRRAALLDYFDAQPDATIAALRTQAIASGMPWQDLYALSEMSYYEGSGLLNNALAGPPGTANDHLFALEPHRHGRIPVVLVHGTASSPFRWGDMVNDLLEDNEIRKRYEFWFFTYNTGNSIAVSANVLRQSLKDAVQSLGGVQADPALGRMVLIGHSQGGLLSKLISIDSGTKLWDAISEKPVDELDLKPETKAMLKEAVFVHHLPFVRTVIFIATPHGGSYQASQTVVGLFSRLVTLPLTVTTATAEILASAGDALKLRTFNSLSGMSPGNPAIEALRKIPMAPGIHAHSIIPTLQNGLLEARNDGVVEYTSAHIDGVESELVIEHSGHSTQGNPMTVREVRRILLEEFARGVPATANRIADAAPDPVRRQRR